MESGAGDPGDEVRVISTLVARTAGGGYGLATRKAQPRSTSRVEEGTPVRIWLILVVGVTRPKIGPTLQRHPGDGRDPSNHQKLF
jgi:hypothetical protein